MVDDSNSEDGTGAGSGEPSDAPGVWPLASFSQSWLFDAWLEASLDGPDHRRHEVLFSVCLVESYLFEWVRDAVLRRDFRALSKYFPPGERRGIEQRFKQVMKELHADGLVRGSPSFSTTQWADFLDLVRLRDGLVHASIGRPEVFVAEKRRTLLDLNRLAPGWATGAARTLLLSNHEAAGFDAPAWLVRPELSFP
jgi:hypothetical protein